MVIGVVEAMLPLRQIVDPLDAVSIVDCRFPFVGTVIVHSGVAVAVGVGVAVGVVVGVAVGVVVDVGVAVGVVVGVGVLFGCGLCPGLWFDSTLVGVTSIRMTSQTIRSAISGILDLFNSNLQFSIFRSLFLFPFLCLNLGLA